MGTAHGDPSQSKCLQRPVLSPPFFSLVFIPSLSLSGILKDALMPCVFSKFWSLFLSPYNSFLSLY